MQVEITGPDGQVHRLTSGQTLSFGRDNVHLQGVDMRHISRCQCELRLQVLHACAGVIAPLQVILTSQGSNNPTLVTIGGKRELLTQGKSALLSNKDSFAVLCTRPDLAFKVGITALTSAPPSVQAAVNMSTQCAVPPSQSTTSHLEGNYTAGSSTDVLMQDAAAPASSTPGVHDMSPAALSTSPAAEVAGATTSQTVADAAAKSLHQPQPLMLLLVGAPGAGKSTFSKALLVAAPGRWVHVNQDTIRDGKQGSRDQCLAAARAALREGRCVVIDRCHADAEQRADFIALAAQHGVLVHAVMLRLPRELCIQRATARTDHPGGVQGPGAAAVVARMWKQVEAGGTKLAPEGCASVMECSNDTDIAAALQAWASYGNPLATQPMLPLPSTAALGTARVAADMTGTAASVAGLPVQNVGHLVDTQQVVAQFAGRKRSRSTLDAFFRPSAKIATAGLESGRTATVLPASVASSGGVVVGGAGITSCPAASNSTAHPPPASTSSAASAKAPSPPSKQVGTQLSPPKQLGASTTISSSVAADPAEAVAALPLRADEPFTKSSQPPKNAFSMLMSSSATAKTGQPSSASKYIPPGAARRLASQGSSGAAAGSPTAELKFNGQWVQALRDSALRPPADWSQQGWIVDDVCVLMPDKYPKARVHLLVVARDRKLESLLDLRAEHIPLLQHIREVARAGIQAHPLGLPEASFQLGLHAVPSMRQLHMHVVSKDFDSTSLKNKQHWASFTGPFFLSLDGVLSQLQADGRLTVDLHAAEQLLKGPMHCPRCKLELRNMPIVKAHVAGGCTSQPY